LVTLLVHHTAPPGALLHVHPQSNTTKFLFFFVCRCVSVLVFVNVPDLNSGGYHINGRPMPACPWDIAIPYYFSRYLPSHSREGEVLVGTFRCVASATAIAQTPAASTSGSRVTRHAGGLKSRPDIVVFQAWGFFLLRSEQRLRQGGERTNTCFDGRLWQGGKQGGMQRRQIFTRAHRFKVAFRTDRTEPE